MKKNIIILLSLLVFCSMPSLVLAKTIKFINKSLVNVAIAIHYKHAEKGWITHGWSHLQAGKSFEQNFNNEGPVFYIFAENIENGTFWRGSYQDAEDINLFVVRGSHAMNTRNSSPTIGFSNDEIKNMKSKNPNEQPREVRFNRLEFERAKTTEVIFYEE